MRECVSELSQKQSQIHRSAASQMKKSSPRELDIIHEPYVRSPSEHRTGSRGKDGERHDGALQDLE